MKTLLTLKTNPFHALLLIAFSLVISTACSRSEEETTETTLAPAQAEPVQTVQIPITTTSEEARALYDEGQYLVDVGRVVQARAKFKAAVASDPSFALGYYGQSNAALSFEEYQDSLDAAVQHSEGISDGERALIEINQSFASNDAAAGLELARELVEQYPQSARARIVLAGMQANQNDNEGARASNQKALELEPGMAAALAGLATNNLFGEPKDFDAAESWAIQFIATYPSEAKGFEILGDIKRA